MADEFIKGLGAFAGGGLVWMILAGWYRTPAFDSTEQLVAPLTVAPGSADPLTALGVTLMNVSFWVAILGPLVFWVLVPAGREARAAVERRRSG